MKILLHHKVFSIALSLLVLVSSLSLTIEKHFCGDILIDVAIFSKSEKCGMEMKDMPQNKTIKKSCCKDEIDVIDGLDDVTNKSFEDLKEIQKQVLTAFTYSYYNLFEVEPQQEVQYQNYHPPNLIEDMTILHETFLI